MLKKATKNWLANSRYETPGLANMSLREPIQAIGYSSRQWREAERGSFADEIRRTG